MSAENWLALAADDPLAGRFTEGLRQGFDLIFHHTSVLVAPTLETLRLALFATVIATLIGVPCGCLLGLGRSATSRVLLVVANALTRFPPVAAGVVTVLLLTNASPWGGGPLAAFNWSETRVAGYMAQTLLAIPIVIALTASAVQGVPDGLLEQARAYRASRFAQGRLALREARRAVFAGVIVAMGVTITAIGALAVVRNTKQESRTLALEALNAFSSAQGGPGAPGEILAPTQSLAVAYSIVLIGLFLLVAAALTFLQEKRSSTWIPGLS
jgi:tungstate transport system permease protein